MTPSIWDNLIHTPSIVLVGCLGLALVCVGVCLILESEDETE